ncbi:hypothetical protein V1227_33890 [Lentzea sp. DG1S-22]|nr:hypothetical protein [Lentzea sp. DG1S-22]WVH79965.1 hypothetical protein V1227_33890 [Lentzea sp. DG1S-22]
MKKVLRRLSFVGLFAFVATLVYTSSSTTTEASRFWTNTTEQSGPSN